MLQSQWVLGTRSALTVDMRVRPAGALNPWVVDNAAAGAAALGLPWELGIERSLSAGFVGAARTPPSTGIICRRLLRVALAAPADNLPLGLRLDLLQR